MADLTTDAFLGGKLQVLQPKKGFRSGVDAVLLAAAVRAKPGQHVLELGCGVGVAALCLAARIPDLTLTGVEKQGDYATLAARNAASNAADLRVIHADLQTLPSAVRQVQYHHVMMNPPYFDSHAGSAAADRGRDTARATQTPLAVWLDTGISRLAPKGTLTVIQHITRLPEVLIALQDRLGSVIVQPIAARAEAAPGLFLLQAKHSGRAPFVLRAPLIMHDGNRHEGDRESYTDQTNSILRDGAALVISD